MYIVALLMLYYFNISLFDVELLNVELFTVALFFVALIYHVNVALFYVTLL